VQPRTLSFDVVSPTHFGHGPELVGPEYTREIRAAVVAAEPCSTWAVPVITPLIWFDTQVETPPAANGSGAPKKYSHVPPGTAQSALTLHLVRVLPVHRWALMSPASEAALSTGPSRLQTPHGRLVPAQLVT